MIYEAPIVDAWALAACVTITLASDIVKHPVASSSTRLKVQLPLKVKGRSPLEIADADHIQYQHQKE